MQIHFVSGFLGSGKTTAIIGACRQLMQQGKQVGVITNDQGRYLVDTAFFRMSQVPAVEVTGGCFCMHYDDLQERVDEIKNTLNLDVIFAEAVGSSADLVNTVVAPLIQQLPEQPTYTVFVDCRLLRMYLTGIQLPFSDEVVYIFEKQIEGSGLLVVNKVDLLHEDEMQALQVLVRDRYASKNLLFQNSLDEQNAMFWLSELNTGNAVVPPENLEVDVFRFGMGEARLAWMDEEIVIRVRIGEGREALISFINSLLQQITADHIGIGHLKLAINAGAVQAKVSFTALVDSDWQSLLPDLPGETVSILVNARLECGAQQIRQMMQQALEKSALEYGFSYRQSAAHAFHPSLDGGK